MAAPMAGCICHIADNNNGPIVAFPDTSWSKLTECLSVWATLDGVEKSLALAFDPACRETAGYHRICYQRITDKSRISRALKRKEKGLL